MLMNVGLRHAVSRFVSFSMHVGSDIKQALTAAQAATKSNIFGRGYAGGARVSVGCSSKGRLWAHWIAEDIPQWIEWCQGYSGEAPRRIDLDGGRPQRASSTPRWYFCSTSRCPGLGRVAGAHPSGTRTMGRPSI